MAVISPENKLHPILNSKIIDNPETNDNDGKTDIYFNNYTRYVVLGLSTLCLSLLISNSLALNFAIICMVPDENLMANTLASTTVNVLLKNNETNTNIIEDMSQYNYSRTEKGALFSFVAFGTLLGTLPITYIDGKFGLRKTFTVYGLVSAFATLMTPFCAWLGFFPHLLMRFLQGVALSTSFPAMGSIVTHWSTLRNSGMYIALLSCHLQFGPIFTMPVSGKLCESRWGWSSIYYLQGILTLIAIFFFYNFFRDTPKIHKNVSHKELKTIEKNKNLDAQNTHKVPYLAIAKDIPVWGVFVSNIGGNFGFMIFMHYGPTYLNKALKFKVESTGFAAALPYVISAIMKFFVGPFSDHFTFVSAKTRVIIFATISQFSMSFCFLALAFLPSTYPTIIQCCYTLCTVFSGLNCVGVAKSTQLMSRQFAHVLMALSAITSSIIVLLIPMLVSILAPNNTTEEWARVFIFIAIICIITTIIFDLTAEVEPRPWTTTSFSPNILREKSLNHNNLL